MSEGTSNRSPAATSTLPPPRLVVGRVLGGRYRLERRIGIGALGEVWEATDEILGRTIAVKSVASHVPAERFEAEARHAAAISHPSVVTVHDYGIDDGTPYLVMERARGDTLASLLRRGVPPVGVTTGVLAQLADALAAAHAAGVVHRDVKPANVVVDTAGAVWSVKLTDFGIAATTADRLADRSGTPYYMAPEQVMGSDAAPPADIYALGVVGYEMLCGHRPFEGSDPHSVAAARLSHEPRPLPDSIPIGVRGLVGVAMERDPARRPDAALMARRLRSLAQGRATSGAAAAVVAVGATRVDEPVAVALTSVLPAAPERRRTWWWLAAGSLAAVLFVGIAVAAQHDPFPGEPPTTVVPTAPQATQPPSLTTVIPQGNGNHGNGNGNGHGKNDD